MPRLEWMTRDVELFLMGMAEITIRSLIPCHFSWGGLACRRLVWKLCLLLLYQLNQGELGPLYRGSTLFQPNPRSKVPTKDANEQAFKYGNLEDKYDSWHPIAHDHEHLAGSASENRGLSPTTAVEQPTCCRRVALYVAETSRNIAARVIESDASEPNHTFLEKFGRFLTRQHSRQWRLNGCQSRQISHQLGRQI
ncbi:hypothetical protein TNCV_760801 [Trichonephila clavipes]|nr:hypothetical protein TNCV_760801 [Trichonephila clavipes]